METLWECPQVLSDGSIVLQVGLSDDFMFHMSCLRKCIHLEKSLSKLSYFSVNLAVPQQDTEGWVIIISLPPGTGILRAVALE